MLGQSFDVCMHTCLQYCASGHLAVSTIVLSCDIMMYSNVLLLNNIIHAVDKVVPVTT